MPFYNNNGITSTTRCCDFSNDELARMDAEQVECIGMALRHSNDYERLASLMDSLPLEFCAKKDELLKLKATGLYHQSRFTELYSLIEGHKFPAVLHKDMQQLWDEAHYKETSFGRHKWPLDAVTRYRVRKKYPYPSTIWDGEGTSYCFKKRDRAILKEAYRKNHMPSQQEKLELSQRTNLSVTQVSNWFKNQRQRARQQTRDLRRGVYRREGSSSTDEESEREDGKPNDDSDPDGDEYAGSENKLTMGSVAVATGDNNAFVLNGLPTATGMPGFPATMPYPTCYASYYPYPFTTLRPFDASNCLFPQPSAELRDSSLKPPKYETL